MTLHWPWHKFDVPNALPSEDFLGGYGADEDPYTWEKWDKDTRIKYPIPWFFQRTLPDFFKYRIYYPIFHKINTPYQWLRCHTWNRHYLLDIRNDTYRYGYIGAPDKALYANFAILKDFVENENPKVGLRTLEDFGVINPPTNDREKQDLEWILSDLAKQSEIRELYNWWVKGREEEREACDKLYEALPRKTHRSNSPEYLKAADLWITAYKAIEVKDQEMLQKLVALREYLWD